VTAQLKCRIHFRKVASLFAALRCHQCSVTAIGGNQQSGAYLQGYALRKVGQLGEERHQVWQPVGLLGKAFAQEGQLLGVGVVQLEEEQQLIPLDGVQGLGVGRLLQVEAHLTLVALPPKPASCWLLHPSLPVYIVTVCVTCLLSPVASLDAQSVDSRPSLSVPC